MRKALPGVDFRNAPLIEPIVSGNVMLMIAALKARLNHQDVSRFQFFDRSHCLNLLDSVYKMVASAYKKTEAT